MLDFLHVAVKYDKNGNAIISPEFLSIRSKDLMVRGGRFYAIWDEEASLWTEDEFRAQKLIDRELDIYKDAHPELAEAKVNYLRNTSNRYIAKWHTFVEQDMRDTFVMLDEDLHFAGVKLTRTDYASKCLPYPLCEGPHEAWDELIGTLYSPEERHKIEWCIGCIVSGDSKTIQKFLVLYGSGGTGKGTVIDIIKKLFAGYCESFESKQLGSANAAFALEPLSKNPIVAYDPDGKLDRIEDNTKLNSVVSHDIISVNTKYSKMFPMRFRCFVIVASNNPVRITDAKSGIIRRLIDVSPTGKTMPFARYNDIMNHKIDFELSGIAWHCLRVYRENPRYYDKYIPERMLGETNDFYNFVSDSYEHFKKQDWTTLSEAWPRYQKYAEDAKVPYSLTRIRFKAELKNYFEKFEERTRLDGRQVYNFYSGFKADIFTSYTDEVEEKEESIVEPAIDFKEQESLIDILYADCPAQYATEDGKPIQKWDNVTTTLKDIDTSRTHYVRIPENHIVIDFDLKDDNGEKSFEKNLEAASKWPKTYAELSKSGSGIHLHYIFNGDVKRLSSVYADNIEVKVFTGKGSLRRKLTKCNDIQIAVISSGLPMKEGGKKVLAEAKLKSERALRDLMERNLRKEIMGNTKPSIDFMAKILNDAYESGLNYDIRDMRPAVMAFANNSSNQADYCLQKVAEMHFTSAEPSANTYVDENADIVFFDVEVFPNLFVVCWKPINGSVVRWINPDSVDMTNLMKYRLVGFNNRKYDNHIIYARSMGYDNEKLYTLSQMLINNSPNAILQEANNISYTDIYDFSSKKQSLKKFEIEYGIHHQELGLPWDKEVPEDMWNTVAEYCENDVLATQVVWEKRQGDFLAREILADLTGMSVNDTTNNLTTKLIFGNNRKPQSEFNYVHLAGNKDCEVVPISAVVSPVTGKRYSVDPEWTCMDGSTGQMMFPGYTFEWKSVGSRRVPVSTYRGIEVGEGGFVFAEPGMYFKVKTLDVTSMHPHSTIALNLFGDKYTKIFSDLVRARVAIKHGIKTGDFSEVSELFEGKLMKYLDDPAKAKMLVNALKIAINSVYGLTAAGFTNAFKDPRNVDNIVAKRGALFMVNLMNEIKNHGGHVVHIKTDSIKIDNITPEIEDFVYAYGKAYGYSFEIEHSFDRICLVNNAVYIAKCADDDAETPGEWTATGKQFQVPYVFKTLFSHEPIEFEDKFETINVTTALYLDMNENLPDVSMYEKELAKLRKNPPNDITRMIDLENRIQLGHNYIFVGKTGAFCPMKPGSGGGWLVRTNNSGGFDSAVGTKGYRWMEAEVVKNLGKENDIDLSYYSSLIDAAKASINEFGDFEAFAA